MRPEEIKNQIGLILEDYRIETYLGLPTKGKIELTDELADLVQRVVDAHVEPILDQLSYTKAGREILEEITESKIEEPKL